MFKRFIAIALFIPIIQLQAIEFLSGKRVGEETLNAALNGRAFFEAYPQVTVKSPWMLSAEEAREDQLFLQSYPYSLSSEEVVLIHREDRYKGHRYLDLMGINYAQGKKTLDLIGMIQRGAYFPVIYLKLAYKRPRPNEVMPNLASILDKPELPSYPSLAATENRLIANVLSLLFEKRETHNQLKNFSDEMNRRRVLSGVSFPSDIIAGVNLADQLTDLFMDNKEFQQAFKNAKEEVNKVLNGELFDEKGDTIVTLEKTKNDMIHVENMPLADFVGRLQCLSSKKIVLDVEKDYYVTEECEEKHWRVALDVYLWDAQLSIFETEDTIYITERKL